MPQGYRNSLIIACIALQVTLPRKDIPPTVKFLSFVDGIIIAGQSDAEVDKVKNLVISTLTKAGWTINPDKVQGPTHSVKFLGVQWNSIGPSVPATVIDNYHPHA